MLARREKKRFACLRNRKQLLGIDYARESCGIHFGRISGQSARASQLASAVGSLAETVRHFWRPSYVLHEKALH